MIQNPHYATEFDAYFVLTLCVLIFTVTYYFVVRNALRKKSTKEMAIAFVYCLFPFALYASTKLQMGAVTILIFCLCPFWFIKMVRSYEELTENDLPLWLYRLRFWYKRNISPSDE